jgi:hypothetical protein
MRLRKSLSTVLTVAMLLAASQAVLADRGDRGWRGGDIRHFQRHDLHRWRGGGWRHGWHNGHLGWWWVVGGLWYFYPSPVYPYPDPYVPPVVIQQAPPVTAPQPPIAAAPTAQYWYYCEPAKAYYPYVATCPSGWQKVPAAPPDAPPR